ncbi:MAG: tRNA-dihydrouridine synthase family protein [Desulfohalobiaceae bacterium]|nr:tRNA-dihydrouridine synthase family protein [Desulfohalobiaceae bacterium]
MKISRNEPWLAPLAGFSDLPFRLLCREYGCSVACTEMVSVKGLVFESPGTTRLLLTRQEDSPLVVQLFGADPLYFREALNRLLELGFTSFDLNAGCPVKKVVKTGAGAALLNNPGLLFEIVRDMVALAGPKMVGVKLRSGWDEGSRLEPDVFAELERLGAGWITLHPRTARQGFRGKADWDRIRMVQEQLGIPVIASGDLFTAEDGRECLQQTRAAGVMFGRGALYDPLIFARFRELMFGSGNKGDSEKNRAKRLQGMINRHVQLCLEGHDSWRSFSKMRTIIPRYLRGFQGARDLRKSIVACRSWEELQVLINSELGS